MLPLKAKAIAPKKMPVDPKAKVPVKKMPVEPKPKQVG